jgi:large subunit ribosomal protein L29
MNDCSEYRQLNLIELNEKLLSLRKEQFVLRMKKASGNLRETHKFREIRRAVARIKTIMTEKAGKSHV